MLAHNGFRLAHGMPSEAARSFYRVLWKWSTVECTARAPMRSRGYASEAAERSELEGKRSRSGKRNKDGPQAVKVIPGSDIFESSGIWGQKGWQGSHAKERVERKTQDGSKGEDWPQKPSRGGEQGGKTDYLARDRLAEKDSVPDHLRDKPTMLRGVKTSFIQEQESPSSGSSPVGAVNAGSLSTAAASGDISPSVSSMSRKHMLKLYRALGTALSLSPEQVKAFESEIRSQSSIKVSEHSKALSQSVRSLMRLVAQPVTVITTTAIPIPYTPTAPSVSDTVTEFRGMTISSFTTVSLSPEPIVSFNIRIPSSTLDAIKATRQFFVHLLSQDSSGREIAQAFTKGNGVGNGSESIFAAPGSMWSLAGPPPTDLTGGVFLPRPVNGVMRALRCEVLSEEDRARYGGGDGIIQVGDHVIVLARILAVQPSWEDKDYDKQLRILCYQHGGYAETSPLESKNEDI